MALDKAGYSTDAVRGLLGAQFLGYLARNDVAALVRRTEAGSPLCSLVRLFLVGTAVDHRSAEAALEPLDLDDAARGGLVKRAGDKVRALIRLRPYDAGWHQFVVASDAPPSWQIGGAQSQGVSRDHVIGAGASSTMLARMTIRNNVGRALDLGTGSGVQALQASLHAGEVVATDVNPRALRFAQFSLELSGISCSSSRRARQR